MVFYIVVVLIRFELFLSFRLTDPIPATETSIAPRQRPKAGQAQPIAGILPIQPALTPRKRASAPAGPGQPISECSLFTFIQNQTWSRHPHMCGFSLSCSLSLFTFILFPWRPFTRCIDRHVSLADTHSSTIPTGSISVSLQRAFKTSLMSLSYWAPDTLNPTELSFHFLFLKSMLIKALHVWLIMNIPVYCYPPVMF